MFINFLNQNNLTILNGHTKGDAGGELTYVSNVGTSVIDYCVANDSAIPLIQNFEVLDWTESDHFPIMTHLIEIINLKKQSPTYAVLCWKNEKNKKFRSQLETAMHKMKESSIENLTNTVAEVAAACEMIAQKPYQRRSNLKAKWFDDDCRSAKKDMKSKLRRLKKTATSPHYISLQRSI